MNYKLKDLPIYPRQMICLVVALIQFISPCLAQTQKHIPYDTNYIKKFPGKIHTRLYYSKKYTNFQLQGSKFYPNLTYKPNSTNNLGVGFTYDFLTLNLAYGFKFLNPEKGKGKTKYLDLQSHIYNQKWAIDFFGQFYKGYFLPLNDYRPVPENIYYNRPDLGVTLLGIVGFRILNDKKFNYNATMILNAWQKKSAGSLLVGGEIYYGIVSADSAFIPNLIAPFYKQSEINRIRFIEIGPSLGYTYTLVVKKNFFATGSLSTSLDISILKESGPGILTNHVGISPNLLYRFAVGYTQRGLWGVNIAMLGNSINLSGSSPGHKYDINAGNFRVTYSQLITPGPKLKKQLVPLDKLMKKNA